MSKYIFIITRGGIGDVIVSTPAIRKLKKTFPDSKIYIYYFNKSHADVFINNPYVSSHKRIRTRSMWRHPQHWFKFLFKKKDILFYDLKFQHIPLTYIYKKSVKEIIPEIFNLSLENENTDVNLFFTEKEEQLARKKLAGYRNVVMMHIFSRSSVNHEWAIENWEELVKQLPEFTFIQVGLTHEPYVNGALDWRGKTTFRELLCLLKHSSSFVGVDSSLSHATNAFDLPGVVIFGDSDPLYWGHRNNINIYNKTVCSPCYYYLYWEPCPYDHECIKSIKIEQVKQALIKQVALSNSRKQKTVTSSESVTGV